MCMDWDPGCSLLLECTAAACGSHVQAGRPVVLTCTHDPSLLLPAGRRGCWRAR